MKDGSENELRAKLPSSFSEDTEDASYVELLVPFVSAFT